MAAFGASFLQYVIIFIILVGISTGGIFFGKFLSTRKDAKELAEAEKQTGN